jgi:hypothetical protein
LEKGPPPDEYVPLKTEPVIFEEEDEEDADPDLALKPPQGKNKNLKFANLLTKKKKPGDYMKELSEDNNVARAHEFSQQCEIVYLKHFGFKYVMNDKLLCKFLY